MSQDKEILALSEIYKTLKGLDNRQIKRILDWVAGKFALDEQHDSSVVEEAVPEPAPVPLPEPAVVETAAPDVQPLKKKRGRRPAKAKPTVEKPGPKPAAARGITGFIKYDNFEELLLFSTAKTNSAKVLLAAAYLQEKANLKEFGSYNISTLFKEIGEEVNQPSSAINNLMAKKPPLLVQTGTLGNGFKSRRKFRVTKEGLIAARDYIKE